MILSASPSLWVRSTTASSRYAREAKDCWTTLYLPILPGNTVPGRGGAAGGTGGATGWYQAWASRMARLTAEITALRDDMLVLASMPTPHRTRSPTAHST